VPKLDWETVKAFARAVALGMAKHASERYTATQSKRARQGRISIDYLRNPRGATAIGAYSARARLGAPISMPLFWEDVIKADQSGDFTVASVPDRRAALKSDPWAEIGKLRQSITAAARRQLGL
jgi:bifunctional non-homologous end joining protein LigD